MNCAGEPLISGFTPDSFYIPTPELVAGFSGTSFNTIATIVAWSVAEKSPDQYDLTPYLPKFDALVADGKCLIVLIDTGGRGLRTSLAQQYTNLQSIPQTSVPDWLNKYAGSLYAEDFYGGSETQLDFNNSASLARVEKFYAAIVPLLRARYTDKLVALAPCITTECEIKLSQKGFRWQSYGASAQLNFGNFLTAQGKTTARMPVIDYPNMLAAGNPRLEPLYPDLQKFREQSVANYACRLTAIIRASSVRALGYFGQIFSFTDGIYATGVIERASTCFDAIAIDYNFYNGHHVEVRPDIVAFLAAYASRLGYGSILVGLYLERFRDETTLLLNPTAYSAIEQSLRSIASNPAIAGVEIGNLTATEFNSIRNIKSMVRDLNRIRPATATATRKIAVYASVANFYLWQGDWSNDRQVLQDNLLATYTRLQANADYQVDIIGDLAMGSIDLQSYDLVVLPHITTMPDMARVNLLAYLRGGGKILTDIRLDDYLPTGALQHDSSFTQAMGIGARQAYPSGRTFTSIQGLATTLGASGNYSEQVVMAASAGFEIAYRLDGGHGEGLALQGSHSTVFGLLPLLLDSNREWANDFSISRWRACCNDRDRPTFDARADSAAQPLHQLVQIGDRIVVIGWLPTAAERRNQIAAMPAARAPRTSSSISSPICSTAAGSQPTRRQAASKMRRSGFEQPTSRALIEPRNSSPRPTRCRSALPLLSAHNGKRAARRSSASRTSG